MTRTPCKCSFIQNWLQDVGSTTSSYAFKTLNTYSARKVLFIRTCTDLCKNSLRSFAVPESNWGISPCSAFFFLCEVFCLPGRVTFFCLNCVYFQVLFLVSVLVILRIFDLSTLLSFARNVHGADLLVLYRCVELHTCDQMVHLFCLSVPPHSFHLFLLHRSKQQQ